MTKKKKMSILSKESVTFETVGNSKIIWLVLPSSPNMESVEFDGVKYKPGTELISRDGGKTYKQVK